MVDFKKFSLYATIFSVFAGVCEQNNRSFTGVNLYLLVTAKKTKLFYYLYGFAASVLIMVMELPMLFSCIECCNTFNSYLKCCSGSLIGKGIIHLIIGAAGISMYGKWHGTQGDGANLGMAILCLLVGTLYIIGMCKGEPAPGTEKKKTEPALLPGAAEFSTDDGAGGETRYQPFGADVEEGGGSPGPAGSPAGFGGEDDDGDYDAGIGSNPFAS